MTDVPNTCAAQGSFVYDVTDTLASHRASAFRNVQPELDCDVYKKPDVMKFTPQDTGKLPRSNHDDLLEAQYVHLT